MKGKKTCIMTTAEHYTLLCVYCFAGKHHSCCVFLMTVPPRHSLNPEALHMLSLCHTYNSILCPHTNTYISVTEAGTKSTFTYVIALSLLYRMV